MPGIRASNPEKKDHGVSVLAFVEHVPKCDKMNGDDQQLSFKQSGLLFISTLFRLYGIDIENAKLFWVRVAVFTVFSIVSCSLTVATLTFKSDVADSSSVSDRNATERVCSIFILITANCIPQIVYWQTCYKLPKYVQLMNTLARHVNALYQFDEAYYRQKITFWMRVFIAFLAWGICVSVAVTVISTAVVPSDSMLSIEPLDLEIIVKVMNILFTICIKSIYFLHTLLLIFICKIVLECFHCQLPDGGVASGSGGGGSAQPAGVAQRQLRHRDLCQLVNQVNDVFSVYFLALFTTSISLCILLSKILQHVIAGSADQLAATITFFCVQLAKVTIVTVFCSKVNDKVSLSLCVSSNLTKLSQLKTCTAEHINYIMYLNEISVNKVALSCGGFFTINKSLIFTFFGTIISYILVLKDL